MADERIDDTVMNEEPEKTIEYTAEQKREIGKTFFFNKDDDAELRRRGLDFLLEAYSARDPEATFLVGSFILDGILYAKVPNQVDFALNLICGAANRGCVQARAYINDFCDKRYSAKYDHTKFAKREGPLVDFKGKKIKIKRKGVLTPIDAELEYKDGRNILTLSANVYFMHSHGVSNKEKFEQTVCNGMRAWEGDYEVFGGQKLTVRVNLTREEKIFDSVLVIPITKDVLSQTQSIANAIGTQGYRDRVNSVVNYKRSFATAGIKWSTKSRKFIFMQSESASFDDYDEMYHVAKHEFGHLLGLGDLYESKVDSLDGVEKGTFGELDSYSITDKFYNLVMCDHHGPISNNDIEMVVLAFKENKMQLYQSRKMSKRISSALGRGN